MHLRDLTPVISLPRILYSRKILQSFRRFLVEAVITNEQRFSDTLWHFSFSNVRNSSISFIFMESIFWMKSISTQHVPKHFIICRFPMRLKYRRISSASFTDSNKVKIQEILNQSLFNLQFVSLILPLAWKLLFQ